MEPANARTELLPMLISACLLGLPDGYQDGPSRRQEAGAASQLRKGVKVRTWLDAA